MAVQEVPQKVIPWASEMCFPTDKVSMLKSLDEGVIRTLL